MFEALRKYGYVFMLILMGLVMLCLVSDEYVDSQQFVKQPTTSTYMVVIVDDFDWDDDDDEVVINTFVEQKVWASFPTLEAIGRKSAGNKCSQALLRGQVRRYSPRNNLSDSHNYTLLSIMKSGVDLFHATFFVLTTSFFKPFITPERGLKWGRVPFFQINL
ncbi:MAG: hypothetical protein IKO23_01055 [Bacteroidales bacterium]|nr:hypothetical protein [Bacteroidales bacterium]